MTLGVIAVYIVFSVVLSEWRIKFVRRMNDADTEANAKAIDSLLNYETVKYFGNEAHEARRYDVGRRRYEIAADPLEPHAVAAQHRPGRHHLGRPGRGHGDGRLRRRRTAP